MNNFTLSQTEPISSLPRDYANLLKRARRKKEPVIFLRRNKPVAALLDWELLKKLVNIYQAWQRKQDLASLEEVRQSLPDYSEKEIKEDIDKALREIRTSHA
ncbi:type II toxin-antitoxin system Phd/YefM family antitoxin [Candidatus Microgenomates bacterium]|nr:type II toxin-antitoxin system Phd/YefM family antitoxin [Candidatus Microgenomates bacterium]